MKQAVINGDLTVIIECDAPIPEPEDDEIIVKAVFAGVNPIDWKAADPELSAALHGSLNIKAHRPQGKDFAGIVTKVGKDVYAFREGDRVMSVNHSSGFAEYSVGKAYTTAIIPSNVSFEDAVTFGLPYLTAPLLLFKDIQALPTPWNPAARGTRTPLLVYGAGSSLGAFAVKLAKLANIHPIIAIAGASTSAIAEILDASKGDVLLDHRRGEAELIKAVRNVAPDLHYAADAIGSPETAILCGKLVSPEDSVVSSSLGSPFEDDTADSVPPGVNIRFAFAPGVFGPHDRDGPDGENNINIGPKAFCTVAMSYLSYALSRGIIKPHPHEVQPNGLGGLAKSLRDLRDGKNRGLRYLLEIAASS